MTIDLKRKFENVVKLCGRGGSRLAYSHGSEQAETSLTGRSSQQVEARTTLAEVLVRPPRVVFCRFFEDSKEISSRDSVGSRSRHHWHDSRVFL
jgi:hypothetical protein